MTNPQTTSLQPRRLSGRQTHYIGMLCHGSEVELGSSSVYFRLPKNVNIITVAKPKSTISFYNPLWLVRLIKGYSISILKGLFTRADYRAKYADRLVKSKRYSISDIHLSLYNQSGLCPEMLLETVTMKSLLTSGRTDCSDLLYIKHHNNLVHENFRKQYVSRMNPACFFMTRKDTEERIKNIKSNKYIRDNHVCADALCNKNYDQNEKGCRHAMSYAAREDLDELHPICKQISLSMPWKLQNLRRSKLDIYKSHIPQHSSYVEYIRKYIHYRLNYSDIWMDKYGDNELMKQYSNARFLLSDFIKDHCDNELHTYNIVLAACREPKKVPFHLLSRTPKAWIII